ncbi:hypothetical protein GEMRC1_000740 [Eukaryota sp. GEM-RC1]
MECLSCCEPFDLAEHLPLLICNNGHTVCSSCSELLNNCPLCRIPCLEGRQINFALRGIVEATRQGDLCPKIDESEIVLGEEIAKGGFAEVYAAEWFQLPIAVKMISLTEEGRLKLQKELNFLLQLNHPGILRVFGLTFFNDKIGIVMEKASSSLPTPNVISYETVQYAIQLCQAVKFLHSKSVVHGDLKPANILLVDGKVRIADFGTSRNISATCTFTRSSAITHKYAAPEQFDGEFSPMSDVYALGIVLYELFSNQLAFKAKIKEVPFVFDDSIPMTVKNIITKCMAVTPSNRPQVVEILSILNNLEFPAHPQIDISQCFEELSWFKDHSKSQDFEIDRLKSSNDSLSKEVVDLQQKVEQLEVEAVVRLPILPSSLCQKGNESPTLEQFYTAKCQQHNLQVILLHSTGPSVYSRKETKLGTICLDLTLTYQEVAETLVSSFDDLKRHPAENLIFHSPANYSSRQYHCPSVMSTSPSETPDLRSILKSKFSDTIGTHLYVKALPFARDMEDHMKNITVIRVGDFTKRQVSYYQAEGQSLWVPKECLVVNLRESVRTAFGLQSDDVRPSKMIMFHEYTEPYVARQVSVGQKFELLDDSSNIPSNLANLYVQFLTAPVPTFLRLFLFVI